MKLPKSVTIAIIQSAPVYLDLEKSMQKAVRLVEEAVEKGGELVVFGETWLTGYPVWIDYATETALWDHPTTKRVFAKMWHNSVEVDGKEIATFCALAKKHGIVICIGINEKVTKGIGNGTIYNTLLLINENGEIANHHRKLMPTFTEKLLYGIGDGHGLKAIDTKLGRVSGAICWEHWMPLTRQTLHNSGEHLHIAVWPTAHEKHQLASRHYAFEGRCFVIAVGQIMRVKDIPKGFTLTNGVGDDPEKMILYGGSSIIAPNGDYLLSPQYHIEGILIHTIENLDQVYEERLNLDTTGHYNRLDVFDFKVNKERRT